MKTGDFTNWEFGRVGHFCTSACRPRRMALSPSAGIVTTGGAPLLALFEKWLLSAAGGKGFVTVGWCALSPREFHHAATLPS
jgi:hypothetical protein